MSCNVRSFAPWFLASVLGIITGCRCEKDRSAGGPPSLSTSPTPVNNVFAEPRFPNHAAIFYREYGKEDRICWYIRPKEGDTSTNLISAKAFRLDEFRSTFQNRLWLKSEYAGLNDDLIDALGRALLLPLKTQGREVLMVDVGPAGFDWIIKGVSLVKGQEGAPECPSNPR